MRISLSDGTSIRAEDLFDNAVDQWEEQTPESKRTFESFRSFMKLTGFDWGHEWMVDRWEEIQEPEP